MNAIWQHLSAGVVTLTLVLSAGAAPAQDSPRGRPGRLPPAGAGVTPVEIQKMFEAVALVRAQEALKLDDDRYLPFLAKYKALQDVRRQMLQERAGLLRELGRLAHDGGSNEAPIRERLKALADLDRRSEGELHKAYEAIDAVLDVQQQARFRVFEEMMERQKIEILLRARLANRQNRRLP